MFLNKLAFPKLIQFGKSFSLVLISMTKKVEPS